jgi:hypothetical protein
MGYRTHTHKAVTQDTSSPTRVTQPPRPFSVQTQTSEESGPNVRAEAPLPGHSFGSINVRSESNQPNPSGASNASFLSRPSAIAPIQLKKKGTKKQEQRLARATAYRERQQQRQQDLAFGPGRAGRRAREEQELNDSLAWATSLAAAKPVLPKGYTASKEARKGSGEEALTSFPRGRKIKVTYDPTVPSGKKDKRIGQLASTFTHELAVHGKNATVFADPDEEHRSMHDPKTRNEYLGITHRTFNRLDNEDQKRAFARSWHKDMRNQIEWDDEGDYDKKKRYKWARQKRNAMLKAIEDQTDLPEELQ